MKYTPEHVLALLDEMGLAYGLLKHPAVYNMEEIQAYGIAAHGPVAKNLFLKDGKGKQHYLVSMPLYKRANLAVLAEVLGSGRLSFASPQRLEQYLGVAQGAVSPLGVLNDAGHTVQVVLDQALLAWPSIGVHPNDNRATVWLAPQDLLAVLAHAGNLCQCLVIPDGDNFGTVAEKAPPF